MNGLLLACAAALAAACTSLIVPRPGARAPVPRAGPVWAEPEDPAPPQQDPSIVAARASRHARVAGGLAGVAAWLLLGGTAGIVAGAGCALLLPLALARLEPAASRRRRLELVRTAPLVADLLAASLAAGVPLDRAVSVVARAVGGAPMAVLAGIHRRVALGEAPAVAWTTAADLPGLGGIARAVARSARTGAPLAELLTAAAADLRAEAAAAGLAEVRATAVRAVLPLGLCLLPAFTLLGVVPIVGGLVPSL